MSGEEREWQEDVNGKTMGGGKKGTPQYIPEKKGTPNARLGTTKRKALREMYCHEGKERNHVTPRKPFPKTETILPKQKRALQPSQGESMHSTSRTKGCLKKKSRLPPHTPLRKPALGRYGRGETQKEGNHILREQKKRVTPPRQQQTVRKTESQR